MPILVCAEEGREEAMMASRWNRQNGWMAAVGRLALDLAVFNLATVLAVLARFDFRVAP